MQSIIIVGKNQEKRQKYIQNFCRKHEISQFDQTIIAEESSIGIKAVRDLQEKVFLKPFQSKEKIIILENAQNLTTEAQNALLKILEEPPSNTYIILSATTAEHFLSTVVSRCTIIILEEYIESISEEDKQEIIIFFQNLLTSSPGEKLARAEELTKDKTKTIEWLEKAIVAIREVMLQDPRNEQVTHLQLLQETHTVLTTTNVTPRFAIEHLFLQYV